MRKLLGVLALSISATAVAYANPPPAAQPQAPGGWTQPQGGWTQGDLQALDNWLDQFGERFENWFYATWGSILGITDPDAGQGGGAVSAPEFDPAEMIAALTLLSGGLAVLRGRGIRK
jgi:hypothetical protein